MHRNNKAASPPWYREPWPWILMAGPAIVVVAGFVTLGMAIHSADGLVADDYYKQGKAINLMIARDARARELGYRGSVSLERGGRVAVAFSSTGAAAPPIPRLKLTLHHPTRAGFDREVTLAHASEGYFVGNMPTIDASRWSMTLEDDSRAWRLTGEWREGVDTVMLGVAR